MVNWRKLTTFIPNKIQVSKNHHYNIYWEKPDKSQDYVGQTFYNKSYITLVESTNHKELIKTYLHEVAHAISGEYDLNLTENQIKKLESALYYVLKPDNIFKGSK